VAEGVAQGHGHQPAEGDPALSDPTLPEPASEPVPPGWYDDPFGRRAQRYWDGTAWTAYAGSPSAVEWDALSAADGGVAVEATPGLPGIATAAVCFALGVAATFAVGPAHERAGEPGGDAGELLLSSVALWSFLIAAAVLISRRRGSTSLVSDFGIRFQWSDVGYGFAAALVARMLSGFAGGLIPLPSRSLDETRRDVAERVLESPTEWLVLALVVIVGAPVVEEIFFRGVVQRRLVTRLQPVVGIGVASVLFGAAHLIAWDGVFSLAYAWAVAAGGIVLGAVYHLTGRLGTAIAGHAFFNAQAILVLWAFS
jgi:membrane protease YdiL (CAAX protease family)